MTGQSLPLIFRMSSSCKNFSLQQVQELMAQYTDETGQSFSSDVIVAIHRQTAGQPFLVNRFGQILTEELEIPKTDTITMSHFFYGTFNTA